jgi:RNA polymerase sigma-70 factor (ECF subfamily)
MGEVADLRRTSTAPDDPVDAQPPAFERFFEEQKERLLRILSVITGSRAEAEDLAQEAFTRVFERWDTVASMADPAGYLHRTAMNVFRNQYRRARVAIGRAMGLGPEQDVFKPVEDRDVAARALGALTPRQRAAMVLTEALGYSGEETGPGRSFAECIASSRVVSAALQRGSGCARTWSGGPGPDPAPDAIQRGRASTSGHDRRHGALRHRAGTGNGQGRRRPHTVRRYARNLLTVEIETASSLEPVRHLYRHERAQRCSSLSFGSPRGHYLKPQVNGPFRVG